ncbi:hypothetical protein PTI98_008282 [Pleurotus ostreatus]|nr:hypothetical protein PTI98_008282 [Pleurotus ostreatus]
MWAGSEDEDDNASPTLPSVQITPAIREPRDHRTFGNGRRERVPKFDHHSPVALAYAPYSKPAEKAEASLPAKGKGRRLETEAASSVAESSIATSRRDEADTGRIGSKRPARAREKKGKLLNEQERKEMLEADKWAKNILEEDIVLPIGTSIVKYAER